MKNFKNTVLVLLFIYPVGIGIVTIFQLLRLMGVLKVKGLKNFPHWRHKVLVVSNHPYKGEQFLLIALFSPDFLLHPFKCGPYNLVDKRNYYDKPRYRLIRSRFIPVDRTHGGDAGSLVAAKKIFAEEANIIMYPEAGRTDKGTSFLTSRNGKRIRPLKGGFAILAAEPGAIVVPVWVEFNSRSDIRLTIGEQQNFNGISREEIVEKTQKILLGLAEIT